VSERVKPRLRGAFDVLGLVAALAGLALLAAAPTQGALRTGSLVYGATLVGMFAASSAYHFPTWSLRARLVLRRLDHSVIYFLLAGTYTPFALLESGERYGLWGMWIFGACGAVLSTVWTHMPRTLRAIIYVGMGLSSAPLVFRLPAVIGWPSVWTLVASSALYICGAAIYARRWPNPRPAVFGYHELFHVFVIAAAFTQLFVVYRVLHLPRG
jgi:hemolysin III